MEAELDPLGAATADARDGCVVESRALSGLLHEFARSFSRRNPDAPKDIVARSVIKLVAERAGLAEGTVANLLTCDERGEPCGRYFTTELWIADRIVTAIERPEVFYDGSLTVWQNPAAKKRARRACCAIEEFPIALYKQRRLTA